MAELKRPGFYPAGGGKISIAIEPAAKLAPLQLGKYADLRFAAQAICAELPSHIGRRELATLCKKLPIDETDTELVQLEQYGPGNVVSLFAHSDQLTETFVGFGQKNVRAEKVASRIIGQVRKYQEAGVAVGLYLADQLLIPLPWPARGNFSPVNRQAIP